MRSFSTVQQAIGLGIWILVSFAAAAIGGVASSQAGDFYLMLDRPAWAPPGGLFGPVWSVLYTLQGIAAWLVWREGGFRNARAALLLFLAQLLVNGLWTWLFFVWRMGGVAFGEILLLLLMIVATMILFGRVRTLAAWLLLPYLLWVAFASALTWSIWQRNSGLLS